MYKVKKTIIIIIIFLMLLSTSGCWDKLEINERNFVTAISIDKNKNQTSEDKLKKENSYDIGFSVANLKAFFSGEGEPSFLFSATGSSLIDVITHLMNTTNRYIHLEHAKTIIISDELAEDSDSLKEILDGLERNPYISRRTNILISNNTTAKDVISVKSEIFGQIGFYIDMLLHATNRPARFNPQTLGEFLQQLITYKSALIPRITVSDEDILLNGSAVIKDYTLIGYVNGIDTRSIMFINNEVKVEEINVLYEDILLPFHITYSKAKKRLVEKDDKIKVIIDIDVEGDIRQYKLDTKDSLFDNKKLESIEKEINNIIKKQIEDTVSKLQYEYSVDLINVGDYISKYKPKLWKELEDNWDEKFKQIAIEINVDAKIRRIGMIK